MREILKPKTGRCAALDNAAGAFWATVSLRTCRILAPQLDREPAIITCMYEIPVRFPI
jgi:hypothetical protein